MTFLQKLIANSSCVILFCYYNNNSYGQQCSILNCGSNPGCQWDQDTASATPAAIVNTSPCSVRRTPAKLFKPRLAETATAKAGACWLAKDAKDISPRAVATPKAFVMHSYPKLEFWMVNSHIKAALEKALAKTRQARDTSVAEISLAQVVS